jgi:hypothetical protein
MPRPRNAQELVHWLEIGAGARFIRLAVAVLAAGVLSLTIAWKQFHGATSEATLLQADVGRQLARGQGCTTHVNYPQVVAFLNARGQRFDARQPYPELYQAPLYSLVVAGGLRLVPARWREELFHAPPTPPDGAPGDYFLLGLNVLLLWIAAVQVFHLTRRLFDARAAWVALGAFLVSVGIWQQTLAINGGPLLMVLLLAAFTLWERIERDREVAAAAGRSGPWLRLGGLGVVCGLLFLTEYAAGALVLVAIGYAATACAGRRRGWAAAAVAVGFLLCTGPWLARNVLLTGNPVALAAQNVALKAGDPTAEPARQRNLLTATLPEVDLRKLGNKTLTAVQETVKTRLWSGGAMWLVAFFAAGALYRFRSPPANRLRWTFVAALTVLVFAQAALNSGESERAVAGWAAPLIIVFGAGFFFVLLGSNETLRAWPRLCATVLLVAQSLPLLHDALEPRRLHFQYPPYFPGLFIGMRQELERRDHVQRFGIMADVPAGVAWYGDQRVWSQPGKLRDFFAITLEQPLAELLLTPRTLDRPFFSELAARPVEPGALGRPADLFGEWGRIYAGLFNGVLPQDFPLRAPQKLSENLYVLLNPALPPAAGK